MFPLILGPMAGEPEPHVFGPLEPEPPKNKPGAKAVAVAAWEKIQKPETEFVMYV